MSNIKRCFTSRWEGGSIVEIDWAQLEVVMLQVESQDEYLGQQLREGVDLHCAMTAEVFREDYATVYRGIKDGDSHWIARRKKMKSARFALQYGAGIKKIAETSGFSEAEAKVFVDTYFTLYRGIRDWNTLVKSTVINTSKPTGELDENGELVYKGQYTSPNGRRYVFTGTKNKWGKLSFPPTKLQNYPIQGLASDFVKMMRTKVIKKLYSYTCAGCSIPVNTIHDSVIFDCQNKDSVQMLKYIIDEKYGNAQFYLADMLGRTRRVNVPFNYTFKVNNHWS